MTTASRIDYLGIQKESLNDELDIARPRGSLFVFDGLLIHKAGDNELSNYRRAINHQYTRPFIEPQVDYISMMDGVLDLESRAAQLMGFWSRPPKTIQEYRVDRTSARTEAGRAKPAYLLSTETI
jgi:ectoine hydroxylase-related dioxygenase (phytanoyl-CoA dioxygenase family)